MIIDLRKFIADEGKYWMELETLLERIELYPDRRLSLDEAKRFHYLYQRTASDLARISTFSAEPEMRRYLEALTARAYAEINETRERRHRLAPFHWFFVTLPVTFRRHIGAFYLTLAVTLMGVLLGGFAAVNDPSSKEVIFGPFPYLKGSPSEHVAEMEGRTKDPVKGHKASFAAQLMTHNTKVSILTMSLGMTYGIGTVLMLFFNGIILGAVIFDFVNAGQALYMFAWIGPHGVIEIPAIFVAGQSGFLLAATLIGRGSRQPLKVRLRAVGSDLVTLICGVGLMLIWAGIIESFISQYHKGFIPYELKIGFAVVELLLLALFLGLSGRGHERDSRTAE